MLKFAVVGVGRMGKRHAFNLGHGLLHGVKLQAVCDIDEAALKWCAKHVKRAHAYADYKEMAAKEKLDGVIIATPHYSHPDIACYLIEHGINTLVEKPAAPTVEAAKRIALAAENNRNVIAGISYNQRSNRMYIKAKKMLDSGELGEIQRVNFIITDWYRSQAYYNQGGWRASYVGEGGGCLMNQCIHQLDVLQWLVGMPSSVVATAHTRDRNITVENDVTAIFKYGGFECAFTASTHEIKGVNRLEIACDKGRIVIGPASMKIYKHKSQKEVNATTKFGYGATPSHASRYGYGAIKFIADIVKGQQLRSLRAFRNQINGKGKLLAEASEGVRALQIINGIYLSAYKGAEVNLPIDENEYANYLAAKIEAEKAAGKKNI